VNFMDITDHQNVVKVKNVFDPIPVQVIYKDYVNALLENIDAAKLQASLTTLSAFNTRYYTTQTGVDAAKWIASQFQAVIEKAEPVHNLTVEEFKHSWIQPSIIAKIPVWGPNKKQVVVIGAHEDSVGTTTTGRAPGADDDGSGTVAVLEVFRVLVEAGLRPDRSIHFITYAGEEAGLRGSADIAAAYAAEATVVHAVLQLDMIGYGAGTPVGIVTDFVDLDVSAFIKVLIEAYADLTYGETRCGYACSDHASWTRNGFRSSFPFETAFSNSNPYIHTANDVISHLSFDRMAEFSKLAVGFVIELAGRAIEM